jgi:hypothetical protein
MNWIEKIKENIFPASIEKNNLIDALREWEYRGNMYDSENNIESCQLCTHPELRYQFEIINKNNSNIFLVGSECIKKFSGVSVFDEQGQKLDPVVANKKIDKDKRKLIIDGETKSILTSLVELSWNDKEFEIESFIDSYKEKKAFTPNQLFTILWRLKKYKIPFTKKYFKIRLRRSKDKQQLKNMEKWKLLELYDCLSTSQKKIIEDIRKTI